MLSIIILAGLLSGCGQADPAEQPALVRAYVTGAQVDGATIESSLNGTIAARTESVLSFRVGGRIRERLVENGDTVRAGQVIAILDPSDLALQSNAASAEASAAQDAVVAANADAVRTRADEVRLRGLSEAGAIAAKDYDAAKAAADAAAARLAAQRANASAARAAAGVARNQAGYGVLRAAHDGTITAIFAEAGQVVAPGTPVARLAQGREREVEVAIPETMLAILPPSGEASLLSDPARRFPIALRERSGAADPATRSFVARYRIMGEAPPLGTTATVYLARAPGAAIAIPIAALRSSGKTQSIWVIDRQAQVRAKTVTVTRMSSEWAWVTGIGQGVKVVALGAHLLNEGQRVRVLPQT